MKRYAFMIPAAIELEDSPDGVWRIFKRLKLVELGLQWLRW
jgi:hypothetical protein